MITADYHMHSNFSSDSKATMESMVEQAIKLGLTRICFTDHMDYDFPKESELRFEFNVEDYFNKLSELKQHYKDQIQILCGIECGLRPYLSKRYSALIAAYPFDFVICSSHLVDNLDPYHKEYWAEKTKEEGMNQYFDAILDTIKAYQDFDVYGHLDYAIRYVPDHDTTYDYEQFKDKIDQILSQLIQKGKGIEVNTSGYKHGLNMTNPKSQIIKRYHELGGRILTIGSDGHRPAHLGNDFDRAREMLLSLGIKEYTVFENRKPIFLPL